MMPIPTHSAASTLSFLRHALASLIGYPPVMRPLLTRHLHLQR